MYARQPDPQTQELPEERDSPVGRATPPGDKPAVVTRIDARLLFPGWGPKLWK